ncbi:DUF3014 domain-containing protein [Rhodanobacter sp. Col0626]|uniref:DUF3014 domain-containing protein n=1 Tax=Rhodanobacter sp. Col0626 TaxID=3415679 RepID=UPI003CEB6075
MGKKTSVGNWIGAVVVVLAVLVAGAYLAHKAMHPGAPTSAPATPATEASAALATRAPIQHPIDQAGSNPAGASAAALPSLDDSDASVAAALASLAGGRDLSSLLVSRQVVARIVATVDALPRHGGLAPFTLPARTPKGSFITTATEGTTVIGEKNSARYAPYMQILEATDPQALASWYVHSYPLFQEAYRQLGYPQGYFNDRLIVAIDNLLAAPDPTQPPELVESKTYYHYADASLESLSTGQKLMLRVGPVNEAKIKVKLRAIRAQLVNAKPPQTSQG